MKTRTPLALFIIVLALFTVAACGGSAPVTLGVIPFYTGAIELKPGEDPVADTLVKNMQQNQAMTGQLGVNAQIEQKGFKLPKDATWNDVKKFYDDKLNGGGWSTNSMVSNAMAQANQGNDMFQIANWQREKQNLSVIMIADPTNKNTKMLILSLASAS